MDSSNISKSIQTIFHDIDVSKFVISKINPDYLVKEDLIFELYSIGDNDNSASLEVVNFRAKYYNLINNRHYSKLWKVDEECRKIIDKYK